ncbi:MAG TPA: rod shape-determining protein MreC [Acidobacteria bacterium]|nr:rod shape-determining protein MreC [Acidobacteriota bacterium]
MTGSYPVSRSRSLRVVLLWLLLELIAAAQVRTGHEILLISWLRTIVSPVEAVATGTVHLGRDLVWGLRDFRRLSAENGRLEGRLAETEARLHLLAGELRQYRESVELRASFPRLDLASSLATCVHRSLGGEQLLLDAGSEEGVRRDMPVVGAKGLVGRVVRAGRHRSWVETIRRAGAAVAVAGGPQATPCLAVGTGGKVLQVEYVPRRATMARGTVLSTTGTDGVYPPGIPVARVIRIREGPGAFLRVEALPVVDLDRIDTVLVVGGWNDSAEEQP